MKCIKMCLAAGLRPDPLPRPLAGLKAEGWEEKEKEEGKGRREGKRKGRGGKGRVT